jgi:hypothetical protein
LYLSYESKEQNMNIPDPRQEADKTSEFSKLEAPREFRRVTGSPILTRDERIQYEGKILAFDYNTNRPINIPEAIATSRQGLLASMAEKNYHNGVHYYGYSVAAKA